MSFKIGPSGEPGLKGASGLQGGKGSQVTDSAEIKPKLNYISEPIGHCSMFNRSH